MSLLKYEAMARVETFMPEFTVADRAASYARFRMIFEPHAVFSLDTFESVKKGVVENGRRVFIPGEENIVYLEDSGGSSRRAVIFAKAFARSFSAVDSFGTLLMVERVIAATPEIAPLITEDVLDRAVLQVLPKSRSYLMSSIKDCPDPELLFRTAQCVGVDRLNEEKFSAQVVMEQTDSRNDRHKEVSNQRGGFKNLEEYKRWGFHLMRISALRDHKVLRDCADLWAYYQVHKTPANILLVIGSTHSDIAEGASEFAHVQSIVKLDEAKSLERMYRVRTSGILTDVEWQEEWDADEKALKEEEKIVERLRLIVHRFKLD